MLVLKHKLQLDFPHLTYSLPHHMQLSPVMDDSDPLTASIGYDAELEDNNWHLSSRPDQEDLEKYWSEVEADVRSDPEWFDFADN